MYCIVFDLDRTLVSSSKTRDDRFDAFPVLNSTLWTHIRPGTDTLLATLIAREDVQLCIWTAGVHQYAEDVVAGICDAFGLDRSALHIFSRDDTIRLRVDNADVYVKDLRLVMKRFPNMADVLLVDDDPVHQRILSNRGRVVQVPPFLCDPDDNVLTYVLIQLEVICRATEMNTPVKCPVPVRPQPLFLPPI